MKKVLLLILFLMFSFSCTVFAERGIIAYYDSHDNVVIQTQNGYTCGNIMYLVPPPGIHENDYVAGSLSSFTAHDIYDLSTDVTFTMWIDEYWLSSDDAISWIKNHRSSF